MKIILCTLEKENEKKSKTLLFYGNVALSESLNQSSEILCVKKSNKIKISETWLCILPWHWAPQCFPSQEWELFPVASEAPAFLPERQGVMSKLN